MRLWLSDKASKQLKGEAPPAETLECTEHGTQAYVRTPPELAEAFGAWACGECTRQAAAKERDAREEKRRQEEAAREAKKNAKKSAKDGLTKADDELSETLKEAQVFNATVRATKQRLRDRRRRLKFARRAREDAERALEEAKAAFEQATAELERAETAVPPLEERLDGEKTELTTFIERLKQRLEVADEAWRAIPPKQRKRRDRRTRHQAVQLVEAHRPGAEDPDLDEDEAAERPATDAAGEAPAADAAGEQPLPSAQPTVEQVVVEAPADETSPASASDGGESAPA